ncbi:MAG: TPM domain-containing protein [Polyangiales bacterium]
MRTRWLFLLVSFSVCAQLVEAQELRVDAVPNPRATHGGWVTDIDDVLGATAETINTRYERLKQDTGAEVALVILPTIGSASPRAFATQLLHHWRVGRAGVDDGVLVLHVLDQRRIEIETGYGAEGALPDAKCHWLVDEVAIPAFKAGHFAAGHDALSRGLDHGLRAPDASHDALIAAANAVEQRLGREPVPVHARPSRGAQQPAYPWLPRIGTLLLLAAAVSYQRYAHRRYYRHHARRRSAPQAWIFFAFLGGIFLMVDWAGHWPWPGMVILGLTSLFTGIGAARLNARAQERYQRVRCVHCGAATRLLDADAAGAALTPGARAESQLGAAEYDVWACECGKQLVREHPGPHEIARCRQCGFRTDQREGSVELAAATYDATGRAQHRFVCAHCAAARVEEVTLPRIARPTPSSSGSSSSESSSSGSSSSGSSSSFGGGDSGGGGAGGSY